MILLEVPVENKLFTVKVCAIEEHLVRTVPSMRKGFCVKFVMPDDYFYYYFDQKSTRDEFLRLLNRHGGYRVRSDDPYRFRSIGLFLEAGDVYSAYELLPSLVDDAQCRSFQEFFKQLIYVFSSQYTLYRADAIKNTTKT